MIEGSCQLIAWLCGLFPDSVWIAVFLVFAGAWIASKQPISLFLLAIVLAFAAYGLIYAIALWMPLWLENIVGIIIIVLIFVFRAKS